MLFATEKLTVDLVGLLIMASLLITGVLSVEEGISGFSNPATITVAFMFVISSALLKTGALQFLAFKLSDSFRNNFFKSLILMMVLIGVFSAFMNNTPVVAVFIPVMIQLAHSSGHSPSKLLIPLSFASIFGGVCTLIGTSTNLLVSGIAINHGYEGFDMFQLAPFGIIVLAVGIIYMAVIGVRLLPKKTNSSDLESKFNMAAYLTEIELPENSDSAGVKIMESPLVKQYEMDIIEVRRGETTHAVPAGDFVLRPNDILKVRCNVEKLRSLKDRAKVVESSGLKIGGNDIRESHSTMVEMVITANSEFEGKTLKDLDFRRTYRAIPMAIRHRDDIVHEQLYEARLKAGDVILAEVKNHFMEELRKRQRATGQPFVLLSENKGVDFNKNRFFLAIGILLLIIVSASAGLVDILTGTLTGVCALVLLRSMNMREVYEAINWRVIFLLAGALCLGLAMHKTGLDAVMAKELVAGLGEHGPWVVLSGLYLVTSLLTEIMSNNATAALIAPVALAVADKMEVSAIPFLMAVTFAASSSFMTPIGYQTNTMVYAAGGYRFKHFLRVGAPLNFLLWIIATLLIPVIYPF